MDYSLVVFKKPVIHMPRPAVILKRIRQQLSNRRTNSLLYIQEILDEYQLTLRGPAKALPGAFRNETWLVHTDRGKKVLKGYKKSLDYDQILYEHSILNFLTQNKFPVPHLNSDQNGRTILQKEGRYYALFDFLEGYVKFGDHLFIPDQFHWFLINEGRYLGWLHELLIDFSPSGCNLNGFRSVNSPRWRDLDWYLEKLSKIRYRTSELQNAAAGSTNSQQMEKYFWIENELQRIDFQITEANPQRRIIHGDYRPYNLMVKPGRSIVVLDFELAHLDWRLVDFISLLSSSTQICKSPENDPLIGLVMRGYMSVQPIPQDEFSLLPIIWRWHCLRRIIICLERHFLTGEMTWFEETNQKLIMDEWLIRNQKSLHQIYKLI